MSSREPSNSGRFNRRASVTAVSTPTRPDIQDLPVPDLEEDLSFLVSSTPKRAEVEVVKKTEKPRGFVAGCFKNILILLMAILIPPATGLAIVSLDYVFGLNQLISALVLGGISLVLLLDKGNLFDEVLVAIILVPAGVIVGGYVLDTSWLAVAISIALAAMVVAVVSWLFYKIHQVLKWFTSRDNKKNGKLLFFGSLLILIACGLLVVLYLVLSGGSSLTVGEGTLTPATATLGATIVVAPPPVVVSTEVVTTPAPEILNEGQEGGDEVVSTPVPTVQPETQESQSEVDTSAVSFSVDQVFTVKLESWMINTSLRESPDGTPIGEIQNGQTVHVIGWDVSLKWALINEPASGWIWLAYLEK